MAWASPAGAGCAARPYRATATTGWRWPGRWAGWPDAARRASRGPRLWTCRIRRFGRRCAPYKRVCMATPKTDNVELPHTSLTTIPLRMSYKEYRQWDEFEEALTEWVDGEVILHMP